MSDEVGAALAEARPKEGLTLGDISREIRGGGRITGDANVRVFGVHHDSRRIEPGDMFILDFSVVIGGYRSDFTNTLVVGKTPTADQFEPGTWALYQHGKEVRAGEYLLAVQWSQSVGRILGHFMQMYDVWLTPTLGLPPVPLGAMDSPPEDPNAGMRVAAQFVPFTPLANVTGQPAISLPLYWNAEGLPVGTHFTGRFGDEATLFRLSSQLESARPWAQRRPPVSA